MNPNPTDDLLSMLKALVRLPGVSGQEAPVAEALRDLWSPLVDTVGRSPLGSLLAVRHGQGRPPRPSLMLAAHMDAVGLIVTQVLDGWLRVAPVGSLDPRVLPGQAVVIHGRQDLPGLVVRPPRHGLPDEEADGVVSVPHLLIDTGLTARRVAGLVRPGDSISFSQEPIDLAPGVLAGRALDNRVSLAAVTLCLRELGERPLDCDLQAVATVQEEFGAMGASTSAFQLRPSAAIVVDATYGRSHGLPEESTFPLGGGPTNGWGPHVHPAVHGLIQEAAQRAGVPLVTELMPVSSGTDAALLQIAADGIPTGVVSIPVRYMHSSVEVVHLADIVGTGRLLAALAEGFDSLAAAGLGWD